MDKKCAPKMNQEIKQQWIEALRSGNYQQGKGRLRIENSYCCLGVLCDLHSKETGNEWDVDDYLDEECMLPEDVMFWIETCLDQSKLTTMNDDEGKSFVEIAEYIEKTL